MCGGISHENREHYQQFLERWHWEWALTLRVGGQDYATAMKRLRTAILRSQGGQLASMGIFIDEVSGHNGRHIHAVMLGRFSGGRTLRNIDKEAFAAHYGMISKTGGKGAVIEEINNADELRNWSKYIFSKRNTPQARNPEYTGHLIRK